MPKKYIRILKINGHNCSKAGRFCRTKALTPRRDSNITKGVGGAASGTAIALGTTGAVGTAVTTVGVGISIFVGFATIGNGIHLLVWAKQQA